MQTVFERLSNLLRFGVVPFGVLEGTPPAIKGRGVPGDAWRRYLDAAESVFLALGLHCCTAPVRPRLRRGRAAARCALPAARREQRPKPRRRVRGRPPRRR